LPHELEQHYQRISDQLADTLAALRAAGRLERLDQIDERATMANFRQQKDDPEEIPLLYAYAKQILRVDPADRDHLAKLVRQTVEEPGLIKAWDWLYILLGGLLGRLKLAWKQGPGEVTAPALLAANQGAPAIPSEMLSVTVTEPGDARLQESQLDILQALRAMGAFTVDTKKTGEEIATKVGGNATAQSVKKPLSNLKKLKLVDSRTGRRGGSWLTVRGKEIIDRRRPSKR
jgi:hypothetical protein